ncbi:transketolase [Nocardiopsis oceani]
MTKEPARSTHADFADTQALRALARQLRADSIRCSTSAGSGHPSSSMSAADLLSVLVARHLRYDWDAPRSPANDHLIFSKGHASPLLYSVYKAVGVIDDEELMTTYRRHGHRLQGHPTPVLPWVDVATGSLGQGLSYGVGIAWAASRLDESPSHIWVLCGDSEMTEGSVWEAFERASTAGIGNVTAIVDVNRLGQRGPTALGWDLDTYRTRAEAFGWLALVVDGHDVDAIDAALTTAHESDRPCAIFARTVKGKGFSEIEDSPTWHGKPLPEEMAERALAEIGSDGNIRVRGPLPDAGQTRSEEELKDHPLELPRYELGERVATRRAYGEALTAAGAHPRVIALDAEVSNSTHAEIFAKAHPERFFEAFIAEQQLVATAVGAAVRGYVAFASTFAAFLTRAYDFIRMAGISGVDLRLIGSHAGVEIGADGPSQMALEDLAAFRAVYGSTVLYPSDATSTAALVESMLALPGVAYLRTTRGAYPVLYSHDEVFGVGGSKTLVSSQSDDVTLVGAGVTVHQALSAARTLADEGIACRVIDLYSVKPVDTETLKRAAQETGRILVVEDHYPQGGLAAATMEALSASGTVCAVRSLAVRTLPGSGETAETLDAAGISTRHIVAAARGFVQQEG